MNWLPPNGSLHGIAFDHLLRWNLTAVFWLFVAANILLLLGMLRSGHGRHANAASARLVMIAEIPVLIVIVSLYVWMEFSGHRLWAASHEQAASARALRVEVTGVQFQWYFRYPGSDGAFGTTRPGLVSAPNGNPLGIDPEDPEGRDDVVSSTLMLPAGRQIDLSLRSQDVIHGLFIPGMRLKQDAVPGMTSHLHFTPEFPGTYPILCSQVCGLGHARMQARLQVLSPAAFDHWLAGRAPFAPEAAGAKGGQPSGGRP